MRHALARTRLAVLVVICMVACVSARTKQARSALAVLDGAGSVLTRWDGKHQQEIVGADAPLDVRTKALDAYHAARDPVLEAFDQAYEAIAHAATGGDLDAMEAAVKRARKAADALMEEKP